MDIQFSGAVDFAPLFNNMNTFGPPGLQRRGTDLQGQMLYTQSAMLEPLNQQNQLFGIAYGSEDQVQPTVNVVA